MIAKKILFALMIISLTAGASNAAEVSRERFVDDASLSGLIQTARSSNPKIAAAAQQRAAAEERIKQASAKMGPQLFVAAGALWQNDGITANMSLPIPLLGSPATELSFLGSGTYAAAIALTQIIYSGGSLSAQRDAAKLARDASAAQEKRTEQAVANAVRRAYYALRTAQAKEVVAEEAVNLTKNHMEQAEKLFKAGVVAKNDVLRSKVAVASAELDLIRAKNGSELAMTALRRAVGAEIPAELSEKPSLDAITAETEKAEPEDNAERDVEEAFEKREELKAFTYLGEQANKLARAAQGQLLPQIIGAIGYVSAGTGKGGDNFYLDDLNEPAAAIGMYWHPFDSGEMHAKTAEAKAKAKEVLAELEDMKNVIRMEVTQASLNIRSAESRLAVASRQVAEAKEDYRIAQRRYAESVGTNLDTLDARLALTNSLTEMVTALYDIRTAESDLKYAIGE